MKQREFEELVRQAVEALPDFFLDIMVNVDVQVRRRPTKRQLSRTKLEQGESLLGLYEGIPLTQRVEYNLVEPDIITVFKEPIEEACATPDEVREQVRQTVVHEVAHFFGITDPELEAWGVY
jgi:predicted Zn-dependent protease with MMP-like domain